MSLTRRHPVAATAALLAAARAATPHGAFAQSATVPEVKKATLGHIALTDGSPLIIAREKGFFAKHGMPAPARRTCRPCGRCGCWAMWSGAVAWRAAA